MSGSGSTPLRALLVGIDHYEHNMVPGQGTYGSLRGCVADVRAMGDYLTGPLGVPREHVLELTSSGPGRGPGEPADRRPTKRRLAAALRELLEASDEGDQLLFYYAGHGGRARTAWPGIKGRRGLDECLVPIDVRSSPDYYLRDVEIDAWLASVHARGAFVTVVLDCCHAGGATRHGERCRGVDFVDERPGSGESPLAAPDELLAAARRLVGGEAARPPAARNGHRDPEVLRHASLGRSRDVVAEGYVLLAACTASQRALEASYGGGVARGAFTHSLLQVLPELPSPVRYRDLHAATAELVRRRTPGQDPYLRGEGDRLLFGRALLPRRSGVRVLGVGETAPGEVRLATGLAQGVGPGARLALRPWGVPGGEGSNGAARTGGGGSPADGVAPLPEAPPGPVPVVTVVTVDADECHARPMDAEGATGLGSVRPGDEASLLAPAGDPCRVALELPGSLEPLRVAVSEGVAAATGWLEETRSAGLADLVVGEIGEGVGILSGRCGTGDRGGGDRIPLGHAGPPLPADGPETGRRLVRRLVHLARFERLARLGAGGGGAAPGACPDPFEVSLVRLPEGVGAAATERCERLHGRFQLSCGEAARLTIHNRGPVELSVAVLDLRPDWSVVQLFPACWSSEPIEPGGFCRVPLVADLPPGWTQGRDLLKVVATRRPLSWRWLELPPLAEVDAAPLGPERRRIVPGPAAGAEPATDGPEASDDSWAAVDLELEIQRLQ